MSKENVPYFEKANTPELSSEDCLRSALANADYEGLFDTDDLDGDHRYSNEKDFNSIPGNSMYDTFDGTVDLRTPVHPGDEEGHHLIENLEDQDEIWWQI